MDFLVVSRRIGLASIVAGVLVLWGLGCGGAQVELETSRVAACQAAEAAVEEGCQPDCGEEHFQQVDCIRLVCDELHERIVPDEDR